VQEIHATMKKRLCYFTVKSTKFVKNSEALIKLSAVFYKQTWAKFCQLIASLSVILPQLNVTKFKVEYLKSGYKCENNENKDEKVFVSAFFEFSSSLLLEYGRMSVSRFIYIAQLVVIRKILHSKLLTLAD